MGIPYLDSPTEAEAQCAMMVKLGKAYAVASEDMDSLAFGANVLLRGFGSRREPITEINLKDVLEGLEMGILEFVDLCILCGCDYSPTIEGVGMTTALKLMKQLNSIEEVIRFIDAKTTGNYKIPEYFPYAEAREIFLNPDVDRDITLNWETSDSSAVYNFLVRQKGFNPVRVENGLQKLTHFSNKPS